jgi:hypothetical protein
MVVVALSELVGAVLPPLPCALEGQTYTPTKAKWRFAGPAAFNRRFPIGDPSMVVSNMTSASAMQAATGTSDGAWLVGTVNGGVWRTADISADAPSWDPVTDGQPVRCSSISALSAATFDPALVFAGCGGSTSSEQGLDWNVLNNGDWGGVMYSRDGGTSWAMTSFPVGYYVTAMIPSPSATDSLDTKPSLVVSARSAFLNRSGGGVWVGRPATVSAGTDPLEALIWEQTLDLPVYNLAQAAVTKGSSPTLFAAVALAADTVMVSHDGGITWADFSTGIVWPGGRVPFYPCFAVGPPSATSPVPTVFMGALTLDPAQPLDTDSAIFYRPADGSAPWKAIPNNIRQDDDQMPKDRMALIADPQDSSYLYVAGNGGAQPHRIRWQTGVWEKMWGPRGPGRFNPNQTKYSSDGSAPHGDCRNWCYS